jgi:hypothetical protein
MKFWIFDFRFWIAEELTLSRYKRINSQEADLGEEAGGW